PSCASPTARRPPSTPPASGSPTEKHGSRSHHCRRVAFLRNDRCCGGTPPRRALHARPVVSEAAETLAAVIAAKAGGENRPGQEAMCAAVDAALASGEHLLVEAPTGIGKSLAYLAPAVAHARGGIAEARVVVVTATKGLQEQLIRDDLPALAAALPG